MLILTLTIDFGGKPENAMFCALGRILTETGIIPLCVSENLFQYLQYFPSFLFEILQLLGQVQIHVLILTQAQNPSQKLRQKHYQTISKPFPTFKFIWTFILMVKC